ncbi:MAG: GNAT family N-acetyltransferase [Flavobacteriaceae bacterium]|jgi:ribosomal protein S18 acetylase RimI-like enzyme|nr:GNAT family N-acetyltransferase [Flavobacteriaceae bacterium]
MDVSIKNLKHITIGELVEVFNDSFSDYILPLNLTEESLSFKLFSELIDLELSIGAYVNEKLIGFMLTGVKTQEGEVYYYNAGTGVIPTYRGQRIVALMYDYALPLWKDRGKSGCLILEVIKGNDKAIRAYCAQGYEINRDLLCFRGEIKELEVTVDSLKIEQREIIDWNVVSDFWDIQPSWQNDTVVLKRAKDDVCYQVAIDRENVIGYIAYHKSSGKVFQIAVSKENRRRGIGKLLLHQVARTLNKPIVITNVDESSAQMIGLMNAVGLKLFITQHEMVKRY